jgi:hypothetical protein
MFSVLGEVKVGIELKVFILGPLTLVQKKLIFMMVHNPSLRFKGYRISYGHKRFELKTFHKSKKFLAKVL